jgi:HEAT repeat protein
MQALGSPRDERAAPLLVYILEHVNHAGPLGWVYARAIELLGQLRDVRSVDALRTALYRGEWWAPRRSAALRRAAAAALARIGSSDAVEALAEAAERGPRGVRAAARLHLDTARGPSVGGRA